MKLAEALQLRAELQNRLVALEKRVSRNVLVQEGEPPSEDPNYLLVEVDKAVSQLGALILRINQANLTARTARGRSLTEAISERDATTVLNKILLKVVLAAHESPSRYGSSELRWVRTVDVPDLQAKIDSSARKIREVNAEIQQANWNVELE